MYSLSLAPGSHRQWLYGFWSTYKEMTKHWNRHEIRGSNDSSIVGFNSIDSDFSPLFAAFIQFVCGLLIMTVRLIFETFSDNRFDD